MNHSDTKIINRPMKLIVAYIVFTLFLYAFGPFQWVTYKPCLFWTLNMFYILVFILGWKLGSKTIIYESVWSTKETNRIVIVLRYSLTVEFFFELFNALRRFQISNVSISQLLRNFAYGFTNIGRAYSTFQAGIDDENVRAFGGIALTLFNYLWAFIAFNILLLSALYFKRLSIYNKIIYIITLALIIAEYVATGTNIGVFRIILIFVVFWAIKLEQGKRREDIAKKRKDKRRFVALAIIAVVTILVLFDKIMQSRGGILVWESSAYNIGGIHIDKDSIIFKLVPSNFHMLVVALSSYLSQGYYGMSLSLRLPWEPCYGIGHSMAMMDMLSNILEMPHENLYQYRVAVYGWKEGQQWHTMYSWFANDISYVGVILVMFLFGLAFALAYKDSIINNNPYAKLVIYYFCLMTFFIPCNNQLFQSTYTLFAFFTAVVLWLVTRRGTRIVLALRRSGL